MPEIDSSSLLPTEGVGMTRRTRAHRMRRRLALPMLVGSIVVVALLSVGPAAGSSSPTGGSASSQLEVFSWWTGGGEEAGLKKLITIWNRDHRNVPFKNETV